MILIIGMQRWGLKLDKVDLNDELGLTLTSFTVIVKFGHLCILIGKTVTMSFYQKNISANDQIDRRFLFLKNI